GTIAGPRRTDISRWNCGSAMPCRCWMRRSIFFSGVEKFIASTTASTVRAAVMTMVQAMRLRLQFRRVMRLASAAWRRDAPLCRGRIQRRVKPGSEPVEDGDAEADVGRAVVVVEHGLAVAAEGLEVAVQVAGEREAPVELQRAVRAVAAAQRMPGHQRE